MVFIFSDYGCNSHTWFIVVTLGYSLGIPCGYLEGLRLPELLGNRTQDFIY